MTRAPAFGWRRARNAIARWLLSADLEPLRDESALAAAPEVARGRTRALFARVEALLAIAPSR